MEAGYISDVNHNAWGPGTARLLYQRYTVQRVLYFKSIFSFCCVIKSSSPPSRTENKMKTMSDASLPVSHIASFLDFFSLRHLRGVNAEWRTALHDESSKRTHTLYSTATHDVVKGGKGPEASLKHWRVYMSGNDLVVGSKNARTFTLKGLLDPLILPRSDFLPLIYASDTTLEPEDEAEPEPTEPTESEMESEEDEEAEEFEEIDDFASMPEDSVSGSEEAGLPLPSKVPEKAAPAEALHVDLIFRTDTITDILIQSLVEHDGQVGLGGAGFGLRIKTHGVDLLEVTKGGDPNPFWTSEFSETQKDALAAAKSKNMHLSLIYGRGKVSVAMTCHDTAQPTSTAWTHQKEGAILFEWSLNLDKHLKVPRLPCLVLYSYGNTVVESLSVHAALPVLTSPRSTSCPQHHGKYNLKRETKRARKKRH